MSMRYGPTGIGIGVAVALALGSAGLLAGEPPTLLDAGQLQQASGEQIYHHICQSCHMADARGAVGAGQFPALAGNPRLASADFMIATVLAGRRDMPSFRPRPDLGGFEAVTHTTLSDAEIARVVNYVRSHFGNHFTDTVSEADVTTLRQRLQASP